MNSKKSNRFCTAVRKRHNTLGMPASPAGSETFGHDMARNLSSYAAVVKTANIKAEPSRCAA